MGHAKVNLRPSFAANHQKVTSYSDGSKKKGGNKKNHRETTYSWLKLPESCP